MAAMQVENKNGSRQLIMQSNQPGVEFHAKTDMPSADKISMKGYYGVISHYNDNQLQYIYLGRGQSVSWNGYSIESADPGYGIYIEINGDNLAVSSGKEFSMRFPYKITKVKNLQRNRLNLSAVGNGSVVTLPPGMDITYQLLPAK